MRKVLIVGAGLSGICLTYQLLDKGVSVTLIDNGVNNSSRVAAGMINPIVFRRMTKSWRIDEMLPFAKQFFQHLEQQLNCSFYQPITIRRFFSSEQERGLWIEKQNLPDFKNYMEELSDEDDCIHPHANQFGSGRVKESAHILADVFLSESIKDLKSKVNYVNDGCKYSDFIAESATYKGKIYDQIIFAEGYLGVENPWFNHLPLTQTKGETLTILLNDLNSTESFNRKCFLLPLEENTFKIGSTYTWNDPSLNVTKEARELILNNFTFLSEETPTILSQEAGIRPTTVDRRPIIGNHPIYSKLSIFNGLGAKGYLIAPLLAFEFVESLIDNKTVNKECDIIDRIKVHK